MNVKMVKGKKGREREKTQNSELYYSRIEILGICLFLQSVLANLHASTYTTTVRTLTTIYNNDEDCNGNILATMLIRNQFQKHDVREKERERE